jgi:hypothetical protein
MFNTIKILHLFSIPNIFRILRQIADQPRSYLCYPEMALSSTSLLHVHEPRSALWTFSSGSLVTFSILRIHGCRPLRAIEFGLVEAGDAMTNQLEGIFLYLKYEQTSNKYNVYLLCSTAFTKFIYFIFTSYTIRSPYFYYRARFGCRAHFLRSGTGLVRKDKSIIIRVVGPPSRQTSPPTNWSDHLTLTPAWCSLCHGPVGWTTRRSLPWWSDLSSLGLHRQLRWGLAS